jgi:hypothetical protein
MGLGYLEPETLAGPPRPAVILKADVEAYRDQVDVAWKQLDSDLYECSTFSPADYQAFRREKDAWQAVSQTPGNWLIGNAALWAQIELWEQRLAAWQTRAKEVCALHAPSVIATPEDPIPSLVKWVVVAVVVVSGVYAAKLVLK